MSGHCNNSGNLGHAETECEAGLILPEWEKLKRQGWRFVYNSDARYLSCEHENGRGKFSVAKFDFQTGDRETLAHQIGHTVAEFLND